MTITVKEIALLTGVSVSKIHVLIKSEYLYFPKSISDNPRKWLFNREEVCKWLKNNNPKEITRDIHKKGYHQKLSVFDDNKVGYITELIGILRSAR